VKNPATFPVELPTAAPLAFALAGNRHQHSALTRCRLLRLTTLGRPRGRPCRPRSGSCQRIHQVDDVAGIARFHGRSYRLALALLGSAARRVRFVAVFKFARFDRLHGRGARSKPKFSVAVAAVAVAGVAVATVAAATVAVVAAAVVAVIVTVIGRVAVGAVKGAGA
jgi:hypothetical protein